jgi:Na+-driven multidrug efflux pump
MPGLAFYSQFDIARSFLIAIGKPMLSCYIQVGTTLLHYLLCYIMLSVYELPFYFAGYITSMTLFLNFLIIHLVLAFDKTKRQ